ncbi:MAG TPA: M15 family metallopeptidase [Actinomycetota bacterium]|nr:M15 family metallopeptidase [Actinomycetota bacterium]
MEAKYFRRRLVVGAIVVALAVGAVTFFRRGEPLQPWQIRGSTAWAVRHYGNPDAKRFKARHIVTIDFLGRAMFVHEESQRHFLRLERLFEARAPEYAAVVAAGTLDDWSYENRDVRGEPGSKSKHSFGIALDVNALTNVLGTTGDMPEEVVRQWEIEGGEWGGDWSRPDPMHFETHLTPREITRRYNPDGTVKDWYLEELVGG